MINAGTVAAYLTLDTSDFMKGISAAGQTLTEFKKEQSDGFDSLSVMIGGLGEMILQKVGEVVGSVGNIPAFGSLPDVMKNKGLLATQGFMDGLGGLGDSLSSFGAEMLGKFDGVVGAIGNSAALGALPALLSGKGTLSAQGFMSGLVSLGAATLANFNGVVGAVGSSVVLAALPALLQGKGTLSAQGFMSGLISLGAATLSGFNGVVGAVGSSAMLASLPALLSGKGTLSAQGFLNGLVSLSAATLSGFNGVVGMIGNSGVLAALPSDLRGKGVLAMQGFIGGIASQSSAASSAARSVVSAAKSAAGAVSFTSVGTNMISGMITGLNSRKSSLMATARSIATSVSSVIRSALQINSPSRVMMEIGEFTTRGMEVGLEKGAVHLYDTAAFISNETAAALSGVTAAAWDIGAGSAGGSEAYDFYRASESGDRLERLIDAVERLAAAQSTVEIDGRPFGRLVREYV